MPTVWKFMRELGCTAQRPAQRTWQQDHPLIQHWRGERLPVIRGRAKVNRATVLFADVAGIHSGDCQGAHKVARNWVHVSRMSGDCQNINLWSVMPACGEMEFMLSHGPLGDRAWIRFLAQLMIGRSTPVILVIDAQTIRDTELVRQHAASTSGRLELEFLPVLYA